MLRTIVKAMQMAIMMLRNLDVIHHKLFRRNRQTLTKDPLARARRSLTLEH